MDVTRRSPRFAYLNLQDHPRGLLMLRRLLAEGFVPNVVIDEASGLAVDGRATQDALLSRVPGHVLEQQSTRQVCDEHGIAHRVVTNHNDRTVVDALREAEADLVVLGDVRILKEPVLSSAPQGIVNVHPGLLPHVRGNNPYVWAVVDGLPQGASSHYIDAGVDTGPVLIARALPDAAPAGGLPELVARINELCAEVLVDTLRGLAAGTLSPASQPAGRPAYREAPDEVRAQADALLRARA